ncbi:MAG: hypothetical protein OXO50_07585 [Caldilineaceae bacterium]|nr:hypothetical protein [Caldilineaceae bacterium]
MSGPVWSILVFVLTTSALGVGFVVIFEEICSANRERVRFNVMVGFLPLAMFGLAFMDVIRHYLVASPGLLVVMTIILLAVMGFAFGIGCFVSLRTYVERSSPDNKRWGFNMLFYVLAGIGLPLLTMVSIMIYLWTPQP